MQARDGGESDQILHPQHQRPRDHAVDEQRVLVGFDLGRAGVVADEVEPIWCDDAVERL